MCNKYVKYKVGFSGFIEELWSPEVGYYPFIYYSYHVKSTKKNLIQKY